MKVASNKPGQEDDEDADDNAPFDGKSSLTSSLDGDAGT